MTKLCQITALLTGKKTSAMQALTDIYHRFQKPTLFQGLEKRYSPLDEDGETFPDERQVIQQRAWDCLGEIRTIMVRLIDLVATQDYNNCLAAADVVVNGETILQKVPVTHLLYLEKQLTDLRTAVTAVPTLDPTEQWHFDTVANLYVSAPVETNKTKKIPRTHVKYEATEHHPAQTEMYHEDVVVGRWKILKFGAALHAQKKQEILARIEALRDAVKLAREEANTMDAVDLKYGDAIFNFVFDECKTTQP